jgi:hypothetical protein
LLFPLIIVFSNTFSTFLNKELATAKNIKDRINRHNVQRLLTKICENVDTKKYLNGLFIYVGIDEYNKEIFELIEPSIKCDIFYYKCGNKFSTDIIKNYLETYSGTIIFANGKECIIYEYKNEFIKKKHINANLIKRHGKGGQSQVRFGRLAEESRTHYVTHIIDYLNQITTKNNWIFGSEEIVNMIMQRKSDIYIPIKKGGFYDFDLNSINNTRHWLKYFTETEHDSNDKIYEQILYYLDTMPDYLDFDPKNAHLMKWFISKLPLSKELSECESNIKLISTSKHYPRLNMFNYIGVKYFNYNLEDNYTT